MTYNLPYRYRVVIFLFLLSFITYLDRVTISLVGVRIKSAFQLSNSSFGWVLGAFSLAYALFEIPSGMLGDLKGQKAVLLRIVLWWSVFTALTGLSTGFVTLLVARFLFGMGESGAVPNLTGVISRWMPSGEVSRGVLCSLIGQPAGAAVAPLIVVPVAIAFGWRSAFFLNGAVGLIWVFFCWRWFRNNPSEMKGISPRERQLIEDNRHYRSHSAKIPWKIIMRSRTLLAVSFAHFTSQWSNYFFIAWLPIYLQQGRHFSEKSMAAVVSCIFIPTIVSCLGFGYISDWLVKKKGLKFGRRFTGAFSLGLLALFFVVEASTASNTVLIVCLFTAYIFQMFFATCSFGVCVDIGGNYAGTVSAILNSIGQVGAFFMVIGFGRIVDLTHSYDAPLWMVAGLLVAGGLACLVIDPTRKLQVPSTA